MQEQEGKKVSTPKSYAFRVPMHVLMQRRKKALEENGFKVTSYDDYMRVPKR